MFHVKHFGTILLQFLTKPRTFGGSRVRKIAWNIRPFAGFIDQPASGFFAMAAYRPISSL